MQGRTQGQKSLLQRTNRVACDLAEGHEAERRKSCHSGKHSEPQKDRWEVSSRGETWPRQYGKWVRSEPGLPLEFPSLEVIAATGAITRGHCHCSANDTEAPYSIAISTKTYTPKNWPSFLCLQTELTRLTIPLVGAAPLFTGAVWLA